MTERLYLNDPYLTRFSARVVSVSDLEGRPAAVLDRMLGMHRWRP